MHSHKSWVIAAVLMTMHIWKSPYTLRFGFLPGFLLHFWDFLRRIGCILFRSEADLRTLRPFSANKKGGGANIVHLSVCDPSCSSRSLYHEIHDLLIQCYLGGDASSKSSVDATMDSFDGSLGKYYLLWRGGEWHPITVSRVDDSSRIHFHFRAVGPWTKSLAKCATSEKTGAGTVKVALDGPYGSLRVDISAYSRLILIAGGIGITPMMPILDRLYEISGSSDMLERYGYPHLKSVRVLWTCKEDIAEQLIEEFGDRLYGMQGKGGGKSLSDKKSNSRNAGKKSGSALEMVKKTNGKGTDKGNNYSIVSSGDEEFAIGTNGRGDKRVVEFNIDFHITASQSVSSGSSPLALSTASGMRVTPKQGRPGIRSIIANTNFNSKNANEAITVLVCGPKAMSVEAAQVCHEVGVEMHVESFEY